jgi:hydrogenase-4 component F
MLLLTLILLPAATGAVAWASPSARWRPRLLLGLAAIHVAGTASLWWTQDRSAPEGWLGVDALGLVVLTVVSLVFLAVVALLRALPRARERPGRAGVHQLPARLPLRGDPGRTGASFRPGLDRHGSDDAGARAPRVLPTRSPILEAVWKYLVLSSVGIALALFGTFFLAAAQVEGRPLILGDLVRNAASLRPGLLRAAFVFLLVGYGTKMGLAPLHSWKPDTYGEAPSPVAALMAGALTSCAFLGLARTVEVMAAAHQAAFIRPPLFALGIASLVLSAGFMIGQTDLKRLLAYSSVEHMGILAIALGIGGAGAYGAALHLLNNGLIKGSIFLAVGNVVLLSGTSEASATRGVLRRAPLTGILLLACLFAVTGSPPFGLFVSEFTILGAAFHAGLTWLAIVMLLLLAIVFVGMARLILGVVYGTPEAGAGPVAEPFPLVAGPLVLGGLVLILGLYIPPVLQDTLARAAGALGGGTP